MAYVDHAFSITDEDIMMETTYTVNNKPPIKEIALAISFLILDIVIGDKAYRMFFAILGGILFIPGSYYERIYYAYKLYKGFSFTNIPPM